MNALLALDPLLISGHLGWRELLIIAIKVLVVFGIALVATIVVIWFERKAIAGLQNRIGPNKAGPYGLLQTLADGLKLILKEGFIPDRADPLVYRLAPYFSFVPAFLVWALIPLGGDFSDGKGGVVHWFGRSTRLQLVDSPMGVLLLLVLSSIAVYGIMLAGWSSGSKYPLLGSVRASSQMVSYEAGLGLSLATVLLLAGTLSTSGIVGGQDGFGDWNVVATGVVPFVIFMICATAEMNRPPFDLVEAEQELVGGFNTEYAGFRFALFYIAEFMNAVSMSAVIVTLFFGGPQRIFDIPVIPNDLEGSLWLLIKVVIFLYIYVWIRATLPRLRYDQLMSFGWKLLIPLSLGWFLLMALIQLGDDRDWNRFLVAAVGFVGLAACGGLLLAALRVGKTTREREGAMF